MELAAIVVRKENRFAYKTTETNPIYLPTNRIKTPYQTEKSINRAKVSEYVRKFKEGEAVDPLIIGYSYDLHDGHHKLMAAIESGHTHVPCVVGGIDADKVKQAEKSYRELFKAENKDSGLYVKKLVIDAYQKEVDKSYENGPDLVAGAKEDDEWAQIWCIGMDWTGHYYMIDSKSEKPRLIASCDTMIDEGKYKYGRLRVLSDVDKKWDGELAPHRIWQETVDNWIKHRMKKHEVSEVLLVLRKGGPGSGDFNHAGRPGQVGGSQSAEGRAGKVERYGKEGHKGELSTSKKTYFTGLGASPEQAENMAIAMFNFTGGYYSEIRLAQTTDKYASYREQGQHLEDAIKLLPKWANTSPLYRGIGVHADVLDTFKSAVGTGKVLDMRGTSSWTNSSSIADDFSTMNDYDPESIPCIFRLEGGSKYAASVKHLSENEHEDEVIMSKMARFTITGYEEKNGTHYFTVKQRTKYASPNLDKSEGGINVRLVLRKGGPGSGDFNHAGRPGLVGGSQESSTRGPRDKHRYGKEGHQGDHEVQMNEKISYFKKLGANESVAEDMAMAVTKFSGSGSSGIRACQMGTFGGDHLKETYTKMGKDLEKALRIMPKWASTAPLYRGISVNDDLLDKLKKSVNTGIVIDMRGTSSWSSSIHTANSFSSNGGQNNSCIFTLEGGSKFAASIKHLSSHAGENEVLMSVLARFTIVGYTKKDGKHHFTVKHKTKYATTNLDEAANLPEPKPAKLTPKQKEEKAKWQEKQAVYKQIMSDYDHSKATHKETKQKLAALLSGKKYGQKAYDDIYGQGMAAMKNIAKEKYSKFVPTPDKGAKKSKPHQVPVVIKPTKQSEKKSDTSKADKKVKDILIAKIKKEHPYKYDNDTLENASIKELQGYAKEKSSDSSGSSSDNSSSLSTPSYTPSHTKKITTVGEQLKDELTEHFISEILKKYPGKYDEKELAHKIPKELSDLAGWKPSGEHLGLVEKSKLIEKVLSHPKNAIEKEHLDKQHIMDIVTHAKNLGPMPNKNYKEPEAKSKAKNKGGN